MVQMPQSYESHYYGAYGLLHGISYHPIFLPFSQMANCSIFYPYTLLNSFLMNVDIICIASKSPLFNEQNYTIENFDERSCAHLVIDFGRFTNNTLQWFSRQQGIIHSFTANMSLLLNFLFNLSLGQFYSFIAFSFHYKLAINYESIISTSSSQSLSSAIFMMELFTIQSSSQHPGLSLCSERRLVYCPTIREYIQLWWSVTIVRVSRHLH